MSFILASGMFLHNIADWENLVAKRKRASKPKVKTGCLTCKTRRVKCDETKPSCAKCTSTGRTCDGYPETVEKTKLERSREKSIAEIASTRCTPGRQLQLFKGSVKERRAVEFFFHRTAPQLSGSFSSSFWSGCVLQFSFNEPAIRHAMIAVSSLYEEETLIGSSPCAGTETHQNFALSSYNKAIHSLIKSANANPDSVQVPVMAAIMFICIEFLRGNVDAAITHIEGGIKMIKSWRERNGNPQVSKELVGLPRETTFIEQELVPMFGWLNMLASLFGRPSLPIYSSFTSSETSYAARQPAQTIDQARHQLLDLVNATVLFVQSVGDTKYKAEVTEIMFTEQATLQKHMDEWTANYESLVKRSSISGTERSRRGADLLRSVQLTLSVWLAAALAPNEMAWDMYLVEYEEIVRLCEGFTSTVVSVAGEVTKRFSFELGIIPPLHFVAWKCRWPHVRRKALSLLWASPRRECLFESHRSYACFARVMAVEEECFGLRPGEVPGETDLPPEQYRIHQVDISGAPSTDAGVPIDFLMKPDGVDGPWHCRTEYVEMGNVQFGFVSHQWFPSKEVMPAKGDIEASRGLPEYVYTGLPVNTSHFDIVAIGPFNPSEGNTSTGVGGGKVPNSLQTSLARTHSTGLPFNSSHCIGVAVEPNAFKLSERRSNTGVGEKISLDSFQFDFARQVGVAVAAPAQEFSESVVPADRLVYRSAQKERICFTPSEFMKFRCSAV